LLTASVLQSGFAGSLYNCVQNFARFNETRGFEISYKKENSLRLLVKKLLSY